MLSLFKRNRTFQEKKKCSFLKKKLSKSLTRTPNKGKSFSKKRHQRFKSNKLE